MPRFYGNNIAPKQGIFDRSATQEAEIGSRVMDDMGKVWRYGEVVEAIGHGLMAVMNTPQSEALAATDILAASAGATEVTVEAAGVLVNEFQLGHLCILSSAGAGYQYLIKRHPAADATTDQFKLTLYDTEPLLVAVTLDSVGCLTKNMYAKLLVADHAAPVVEVPVGIAMADFTTSYPFGWFQCWGQAMAYVGSDGATEGKVAIVSASTDGACADRDSYGFASTGPLVGEWVETGATLTYAPLNLRISK